MLLRATTHARDHLGVTDPHLSDSAAWRQAEIAIIDAVNRREGLHLAPKPFECDDGVAVELDGYCEEPLVLCEAYGRLGYVAGTTIHKACTDALKLAWLRDTRMPEARVIIAIANAGLEQRLAKGRGWVPEMLRWLRVEVINVELPEAILDAIKSAEGRARRGMVPPNDEADAPEAVLEEFPEDPVGEDDPPFPEEPL